jgi:hypothetical protein
MRPYSIACMKCHTCGGEIRAVLDGEEWCDKCQAYQRPVSHGWSKSLYQTEADRKPCEAPQ